MCTCVATSIVATFFLPYTMKVEKKIINGKAYCVKYIDAAYSYNTEEEVVPPIVTSLGYIHDHNAHYINLALITELEENKSLEGLIIPKKVIVDIKPIHI